LRLRTSLVSYFKNNGIISPRNTLNAKNGLIPKRIEEEMNLKSLMEKQLAQKRITINPIAIFTSFVTINPFKKKQCAIEKVFGELGASYCKKSSTYSIC
jgi:hypothetical protein